jgi:general secretion pathway protein H
LNPAKGSAEAPPAAFQPDLTIFKKKQSLPSGFRFVHIESGTQDVILTDGTAYIHFFPQGLIEASAIQIEDPKKNIWTLVYNPITGHMDVIPEAKVLKDLAR